VGAVRPVASEVVMSRGVRAAEQHARGTRPSTVEHPQSFQQGFDKRAGVGGAEWSARPIEGAQGCIFLDVSHTHTRGPCGAAP